jgi:K+-sensing histidine kinase KdpD
MTMSRDQATGERLIRRVARLAARSAADLLAMHVAPATRKAVTTEQDGSGSTHATFGGGLWHEVSVAR